MSFLADIKKDPGNMVIMGRSPVCSFRSLYDTLPSIYPLALIAPPPPPTETKEKGGGKETTLKQ